MGEDVDIFQGAIFQSATICLLDPKDSHQSHMQNTFMLSQHSPESQPIAALAQVQDLVQISSAQKSKVSSNKSSKSGIGKTLGTVHLGAKISFHLWTWETRKQVTFPKYRGGTKCDCDRHSHSKKEKMQGISVSLVPSNFRIQQGKFLRFQSLE